MSLPYCLTNPTLRILYTKWGAVTLERLAPQDYAIFKDGVRLGRVFNTKSWHAEDDDTAYKSRIDAVNAAIAGWYQRNRSRP